MGTAIKGKVSLLDSVLLAIYNQQSAGKLKKGMSLGELYTAAEKIRGVATAPSSVRSTIYTYEEMFERVSAPPDVRWALSPKGSKLASQKVRQGK